MANCHDLLIRFHEQIRLTKTKDEYLRSARDSIRSKIENYFKNERGIAIPIFKIQGSFSMRTTVNPLNGEFDIDDGIYLKHLPENKNDWPTPATVHKLVYDAVEGHTEEKPIDKRTCIRVRYAGDYHVDLPIYCEENSLIYLAEKGDKGWHENDPIRLTEWFIERVKTTNEQLRRMVRYLKAWSDHKSRDGVMPKGIIITILVAQEYLRFERDDACLSNILSSIRDRIQYNFDLYNPIDSSENLASRMSDAEKERFVYSVSNFADIATHALQEVDKEKACSEWKKQLGDRFPSCEGLTELGDALKTSAPAILKDDARSASVNVI